MWPHSPPAHSRPDYVGKRATNGWRHRIDTSCLPRASRGNHMVRARGLGVLAAATLLPFAFACGGTSGGGGTTASTCKPDSVSQVPSTTASTAALTYAAASNALQMAHQGAGTVLKVGFIGILSGQYTSY